MVSKELLQYIVSQEQEGFSTTVITEALKQNNYTTKEIQEAFDELDNGRHNPEVHDYVQEYARNGSSPEETFKQLQQQGYSAGAIRKSIHNVYGGPKEKSHLAAFMLVAVAVGAGGMWLMLQGIAPQTILDQSTYSPSELIAMAIENVQNGGDGLSTCNDKLNGIHREKCYAVIAAATEDSSICTSIDADDIHDSCWMTFIDVDFDNVCRTVRLVENKQTCSSIRALQV